MKTARSLWTLVALAAASLAQAQVVNLSVEEYQQRKAANTLPPSFHVEYSTRPVAPVHHETGSAKRGGGGPVNGDCNCWIAPDDTYDLAMDPNDDGSSSEITLPFQFNLYGDLYDSCWINNNGNVSFLAAIGSYSAGGFPAGPGGEGDTTMVAPFWGDIDTRFNQGAVRYKLTDHALFVNWVDVGYFSEGEAMQPGHQLYNTFQLIITDGTDPVIGVGNNVSFCYLNMDWTTGTASGGTNGFGGAAATVGANRGNGVDFIQFGRFDEPGNAYDGPFGQADGIDWLDGQNFRFTTAVATQNIPPIVSSTFLCDTVHVCTGELVDFDLTFLTPEADQVISNVTVVAPSLPSFAYTEVNNGTQYTVHPYFVPGIPEVGYHTITFTGSDNGSPPLTSTVSIVIEVTFTPAPPPIITGDTVACPSAGVVLTASTGYDDYVWSNGFNGRTVLVPPGSYLVQATAGPCRLASNTIVVHPLPEPSTPVIVGDLNNCSGQPVVLSTQEQYANYHWSTNSTNPTVSVLSGTYTVTVSNAEGCEAYSNPVTVIAATPPTPFFVGEPNGTVPIGATVVYTNLSQGNIVNIDWSIPSLGSSGDGSAFTQDYPIPGTYPVILTVTTAEGCVGTYTYNQVVQPEEIVAPNVFSPNNDGRNDALEFTGVEFYPNTSLKVFNRWGQEVYTSGNYKNTWKGQDMPEGTYFYILKLQGSGKEFTGHVTLLR